MRQMTTPEDPHPMNDHPQREAMSTPAPVALRAEHLRLAYAAKVVVDDLSLDIAEGSFTVIVGPNGCGKSTLLKAFARILKPREGTVSASGTDLQTLRVKQVAQIIGFLSQSPVTPGAITVADLVARGRYPHQQLLQQWSRDDERIVADVLEEVGMRGQAEQLMEALSGGQRQRAWIAMALAQQTPVLLLDEPTTYLDVAHQLDVLDLCSRLHASGRTIVAVLHDLDLAARYATEIVAMREGRIVAQGAPAKLITPTLLREVFDLEALVIDDPETGRPLVVPRDRRPHQSSATAESTTVHTV